MKKIVLLLLCLTMIASFAACSEKSSVTTGEAPTLTWYMVGQNQPDIASIMDEVNKITELKIGAKLDLKFVDDKAYNQRINLMMASGDKFDICFTGYTNSYVDGVKQGGFLKLNDYLKKEAKDLYDSIPEYAWESLSVNGDEIYAVPNCQINSATRGIFFVKEYVDKYNFDISKIKNMNDLEQYLEIIKKNEPNIYPYRSTMSLSSWYVADYEQVYSRFFIRKDDPQAKLVLEWDIPEYKEAMAKLRQWFEKGYIRNDALSVGDDTTDYKAGRYATWNQVYKPGCETETSMECGRQVVATPIDKPYINTNMCTQASNAVSATSIHPLEAIKFLQLINTDKQLYNLIAKGIEGKHYTKIDDKYIKLIKNSGYTPNADWKFGNQFNAYLLEGAPPTVWEDTSKLNLEAQKSIILGFNPNLDKFSTEIAQISSAGNGYALASGAMDMTKKRDEYVKKMTQAGAYKMRDGLQQQIDEFLKNK